MRRQNIHCAESPVFPYPRRFAAGDSAGAAERRARFFRFCCFLRRRPSHAYARRHGRRFHNQRRPIGFHRKSAGAPTPGGTRGACHAREMERTVTTIFYSARDPSARRSVHKCCPPGEGYRDNDDDDVTAPSDRIALGVV